MLPTSDQEEVKDVCFYHFHSTLYWRSNSKLGKVGREGSQVGNEEVKLSPFADNMIMYVRNPMETTKKKKPSRINEFTEVAVYRINVQKPTVFI